MSLAEQRVASATADSGPGGPPTITATAEVQPLFGASKRLGIGPSCPAGRHWSTSVEVGQDRRPVTRVVGGVTQTAVFSACEGAPGDYLYPSLSWLARPSARLMIGPMVARLAKSLPSPRLWWPAADRKFGWIYVNVPMDFRAEALAPVSVTARAQNVVGSAWATVTAVPTTLTLVPGEPRGTPLSCSASDAQAPDDPQRPGACSYRYRDSSAIGADGRHFTATVTVTWAVSYLSSEGSGSLASLSTSSSQPVAVAEIQSLVTCTGPRPEQGGCG
jgi:hypothetical protein